MQQRPAISGCDKSSTYIFGTAQSCIFLNHDLHKIYKIGRIFWQCIVFKHCPILPILKILLRILVQETMQQGRFANRPYRFFTNVVAPLHRITSTGNRSGRIIKMADHAPGEQGSAFVL